MAERTRGAKWIMACLMFAVLYFSSSGPALAERLAHTLLVTATAYNSFRDQTSGNPNVGAWGDRLKPGVKAIAVSRDLLRLGLKHGSRVIIQGLHGTYRVLDKMASRWRRRIDIYMGRNIKAARLWGKRKVRISWTVKSAVFSQPAEAIKHRGDQELTRAKNAVRFPLSGIRGHWSPSRVFDIRCRVVGLTKKQCPGTPISELHFRPWTPAGGLRGPSVSSDLPSPIFSKKALLRGGYVGQSRNPRDRKG